MRSLNDEMHTAGHFLSSLSPVIVSAFSPDPGVRYPHPIPTADRVRLLTRILRLWITVPENFHGPEIHRAFRLLNGGFRTFSHTVHEWLGVKIRLLVPISFLGWLCKAF
jgi:hypothetical protein